MPATPAIHRIAIPNPYFERATNVYLVVGEPVTLIDTGIGTEEAFLRLETEIARTGGSINDIQRIVLTHKHSDHIGLARRIRDRTGATVLVHSDDHADTLDYQGWRLRACELIRAMLVRWEAPPDVLQTLLPLLEFQANFADNVECTPIDDGDRLPMANSELEVIHVPGHTEGSICLRYGEVLFSGDHVLPDYTPNIGSDLTRSGLLARYMGSLERLLGVDVSHVYPGHGKPFGDLNHRVSVVLAHHRRREELVVRLLADGKPRSIYELAIALFGPLSGYHLLLGAGEIDSHLEQLERRGRTRREGDRAVIVGNGE